MGFNPFEPILTGSHTRYNRLWCLNGGYYLQGKPLSSPFEHLSAPNKSAKDAQRPANPRNA